MYIWIPDDTLRQLWDSDDLEYTDDDYEEVTKEFYEELLDKEAGIDLR